MVRTLFIGILLIEYFGFMHEPMVPIMARDVLDVGAEGLGNLIAAGNAGGFAAALMLSHFGEIERKGRLLILGAVVFGGFMVAFAFSRNVPLSLALYSFSYAGIVPLRYDGMDFVADRGPGPLKGPGAGVPLDVRGGKCGFSDSRPVQSRRRSEAPATIVLGGGVAVGTAAVLYHRVAHIGANEPAGTVCSGRSRAG